VGGLLLAMVFVLFSYIGTRGGLGDGGGVGGPVRASRGPRRRMVLRLALFYLLAISVVLTVVPGP